MNKFQKMEAIRLAKIDAPTPAPTPSPTPAPSGSPSPSPSEATFKPPFLVTSSNPGQTKYFSAADNAYTATSNDDSVFALRQTASTTGTKYTMDPSTWDLNGGAGNDTLYWGVDGTVTANSIANFNTINAQATATSVVDLSTATGVEHLGTYISSYGLTFKNINYPLTSINYVKTDGQAFTVKHEDNTLTGSEKLNIYLYDADNTGSGAIITAGPESAGIGYKTFSIYSSQSTNTVNQITQGNGVSLTNVNFYGNKAVSIATALDSTVTTVDASDMQGGGVSVIIPSTVTTSVTGSPYNDTLTFYSGGDTYSTGTTINCGAGTGDIVQIGGANVATNFATATTLPLIGCEILKITTVGIAGTLNLDYASPVMKKVIFTVAAGNANRSIYLNRGTTTIDCGTSTTALTSITGGTNTLSILDRTGLDADNVLNLNLYGHSVAEIISAAAAVQNLNIASLTSANTLGDVTLSSGVAQLPTHINISGNYGITFGAVTADYLDASNLNVAPTANGVTMVAGTQSSARTIVGSKGVDTLYGTTGADKITTNGGNDVVYVKATYATDSSTASAKDIVTITPGTYVTVVLYGDSASTTNYNGAASITGFTVGSTTSNGCTLKLSSTFANHSTPATSLAFVAGVATAAAGSTGIQSVAQSAGATAYVAGTDFIKLTTPVSFTIGTTTIQGAFNTAIGTSTITACGTSKTVFASYYDSTNLKMVILYADTNSGTNTVLETGDTVTLIGTIDMTPAQYLSFSNVNLAIE